MKLGELFMELNFRADTMKLNEFVKSVGDLNMSSIIAGGSVAALVETTKKLLEGTAGLAQEMRFFGTETGMSAQKMESWTHLAQQLGINGDQVASTLKHLQTSITQTKMGNVDQGLMQAYSILNQYGSAGIDISQDYFTQIEKMRVGLKNINPDMRRTVAGLAGVNDEMLNFLMMSDEDWASRNSQAVLDPEQIQRMKEMNQEWAKLSQDLAIIGSRFATDISPVIISTTRALIDLLNELKNSMFGKLLGGVGKGLGKIGELMGVGVTYAQAFDQELLANAIANRYGTEVSGRGANNQTNSIVINVHDAAGNAKDVAKHVNRVLQEQLNQTKYAMPPRSY